MRWLIFAAVACGLTGWVAGGQPVTLIESGRGRCVVVYPDLCALSARTAEKVADYLERQTDVRVPVFAAGKFKSVGNEVTLFVLDGTPNQELANRFGANARLGSDRADAFRVKVERSKEGPPLVLALGKSPQGAKYAAYRFLRELDIADRQARIRELDIKLEPFIKTRSVALFNVWGMPIELTRRHNIESWSVQDLERYIDLYDFYGFNAIESHDRFNDNYLEPLFGLKRAQWCEKVQGVSDFAHANAQQFFLRIWGHSVMETPKLDRQLGPNESVPKRLKHFCPNDPAERAQWESEIRDYYVSNYAGRVDNLIGHWCDPGICRRNGCTYKTPLQLHRALHEAFKARDPGFKSTFSLWFFDVTKHSPAPWAKGGWPDYTDDRDLIQAGILDKEVMIATATAGIPAGPVQGQYKEHVVQEILRAGHQPALWTWYRADHEIRPSLHIHQRKLLSDYFKGLPASARQLEWHNVERNVHGAANTANFYIAGRLMWEPNLDPNDLLLEFLAFVFGSENAARVQPAYTAIEDIRCHSCDRNWERNRFTGAGNESPRKDAKVARAALANLAEVRLDPGYRPRIPLDISPAQMIADLKASLEVIRDFADCRASFLPAIDRAIVEGKKQKAEALLSDLRARYEPWSLTLAGRQEWALLDRELQRLRKEIQDPGVFLSE